MSSLQIALDGLCHHEQDFARFPQDLRQTEVPDSLLSEVRARKQLDALHLAKLRLVAKKSDEDEFHDATVTLFSTPTFSLLGQPRLPTLKLSRIAAVSWLMTERSSWAVLQARTPRISSLSRLDWAVDAEEVELISALLLI